MNVLLLITYMCVIMLCECVEIEGVVCGCIGKRVIYERKKGVKTSKKKGELEG